MNDNLSVDLNTTIATAVQARIEAEVMAALSGDATFAAFVSSALSQPIQVEDRGSYRKRETTYMAEAVRSAIQVATKAAIGRVIEAEMPALEKAVETELRKQIKPIAQGAVKGLAEASTNPYRIEVKFPGGGE